MPKLMIIIASTRPGRIGLPVGRWFVAEATRDSRFEIDVVDLAELQLPFMDEPHHPRLRQYTQPHTLQWSARVEGADAFVLVMPEYNYGYSAPLKNALDYLCQEWAHKPVGLVSYGGIAAGTRAQQQLKPILLALRMAVAAESVMIPFVGHLVQDGVFHPDDSTVQSAGRMLDEIARLQVALAPLHRA